MMSRLRIRSCVAVIAAWCLWVLPVHAEAPSNLPWQPWSKDVFEQAQKERKLVLLDVEAVWCHWCHVMDQTTYRDADVTKLLRQHFILTRADQDAFPDLSNRYRNYGWPATVIFAASGQELLKRRGYVDPATMKVVLEEIVADPTPKVKKSESYAASDRALLSGEQVAQLEKTYIEWFDKEHAGWGDGHKFLESDLIEYSLREAAAKNAGADYRTMATRTLDASLNLIDPVWGGVYQYSDEANWKSPHYEKIMPFQTGYIRAYALAALHGGSGAYLKAALAIRDYLQHFLRSPDGAFYVSQDADVSEAITGKIFYAKDDKARRAAGKLPRIDTHLYARENGLVIDALGLLYAATGDAKTLKLATQAAHWAMAHRALKEGGFAHGEKDAGGPYLADSLAMGQGCLRLYEVTGGREWLACADRAGSFLRTHFIDEKEGGFVTAAAHEQSPLPGGGALKVTAENIAAVRFMNLLSHHMGKKEYKDAAQAGMRFLASPQLVEDSPFEMGIRLADQELASAPAHIAIVGGKADPKARALFLAALRYPDLYRRIEWWDRKEGALPNPDVTYPQLPQAAAFACANGTCSLPITDPKEIIPTVLSFAQAPKE